MFYWNQDNFEGLLEAAQKFESQPLFDHFCEYCKLKEKGLKKHAVQACLLFVKKVKNLELKVQRNIAVQLVELKYFNRSIHQLIPHPVNILLIEIFRKWSFVKSDSISFRWLGFLEQNPERYIDALLHDPNDQISIYELIQQSFSNLDFLTHHLSESKLLGELSEGRDEINKIKNHICLIYDKGLREKLETELKYWHLILDAWEKYIGSNSDISFPIYCKENDIDFNFTYATYYDE